MNWNDYKPEFNAGEFDCKCGCQLNKQTSEFMDMLLKARRIAGIPFKITSGTRCSIHNLAVSGAGNSDHLTGEGADIWCMNNRSRWIIVDALKQAGFKRIGIARSFIHAGCREENLSPSMWVYS